MKIARILPVFWPFLAAIPLLAQPQIGGGVCDSSTLSGTYSLTLSGGALATRNFLTNLFEGIGTATFDGSNKIVFTLTTNDSNAGLGIQETLSGTYSLQANCIGTLNINSGGVASYVLSVFDGGASYLISGQDGTRSLTGSGRTMPATSCSMTTISGAYAFNGDGFGLVSRTVGGNLIAGVSYFSGLFQFDGAGNASVTWFVQDFSLPPSTTASGTYAVTSACTGTATIKDSSGNSYAMVFTITDANGSFVVSVANTVTGQDTQLVFIGSGRPSQPTASSCSLATLSGTRSLVLTGRYDVALGQPGGGVLGSVLESAYLAVGTANFDGNGNVTFNQTATAGAATGTPQTWTGTYSLSTNCLGTLTITGGDTAVNPAVFTFIAGNSGESFTITGFDSNFYYTGSGAPQPATCLPATLSGAYAFAGDGYSYFSGSALGGPGVLNGVNGISGLLQFDGAGVVSASWTVANSASETSDTLTGTYSVSPSCTAMANLSDSTGRSYSLGFSIASADAGRFSVVISNPVLGTASSSFTATGHSTFNNPGLAVELAAGTGLPVPPGSLFSIYGSDLAGGPGQFTTFPLPTNIESTSVSVDGETVPLYYVDKTLINGQMPLDVKPGVATLVVKNGSATSNSVAINIAAGAAPGIFIYGNNHAAAQNLPDYSLNSETNPAIAGQTVVLYFTGGGPVQGQASLGTGEATPDAQFPITEPYSVTIDGIAATVDYTGLVPTAVGGCYQANVVIPNVQAGDHNLIITIGGAASNSTVISTK